MARVKATGSDSKDGSTVMSVLKADNGLLHRREAKEERERLGEEGRRLWFEIKCHEAEFKISC
jgi:hypothetical protein